MNFRNIVSPLIMFLLMASNGICVAAGSGIHVSTVVSGEGKISPIEKYVSSGKTAAFTVKPGFGYAPSVSGCDGTLVGTKYTTASILAECTVMATFVPQPAALTIITKPLTTPLSYNGKTGVISFTVTGATTQDELMSQVSVNDPSWLSAGLLTYNGKGKGNLKYTVAANASSHERQGSISIAGQSYAISQSGKPSKLTITPSQTTPLDGNGGSMTVDVSIDPQDGNWSVSRAKWVPTTSVDWLKGFTVATPQTGSSTLNLIAESNNSDKPRSVVLALLSSDGKSMKTLTVKQAPSAAPATDSIVGSWYIPYPTGGQAKGPIVITFIDSTNFMMAHDGDVVADPSGRPGIEKGTYTWDPKTGALAAKVTVDTNGEWGFSGSSASDPVYVTVSADGNSLLLDGTVSATKINRSGSSPLIGSWYIPYPTGGQAKGPIVITFIDSSNFMMAHDGDVIADPSGNPGIEKGTYTWSQANGTLAANVTVDTNGDWGFASAGNSDTVHVTVSSDGGLLLIDGTISATRVE